MLKIRLQGTKNDIRWFIRLMQRDKKFSVENVSTFFDNAGTNKYKRVYAEIHRKGEDTDKERDLAEEEAALDNKSKYVGSGAIFR